MALYFLVGPSGIGKSTTLDKLIFNYSIKGKKLDCLLKEYLGIPSVSEYLSKEQEQTFFIKSFDAIQHYRKKINTNEDFVIDVGAGSLEYKPGHTWFANQNLISLIGEPGIIWKTSEREKHYLHLPPEDRLSTYTDREYTQRIDLYNSAKLRIDVTPEGRERLSEEEIANQIYSYISSQIAT